MGKTGNSSGGWSSLQYSPQHPSTQNGQSSLPNGHPAAPYRQGNYNGDGGPTLGSRGTIDTRGMSPVDQAKLESAAKGGMLGSAFGTVGTVVGAAYGYNNPSLDPDDIAAQKGWEGRNHQVGGHIDPKTGGWVSGTSLPSQHRTVSPTLGSSSLLNDDDDDDDKGRSSGFDGQGSNSGSIF